MRRTLLALTALASLLVVLATGGSGALAISNGVFSGTPDSVSFGHVSSNNPQTKTETLLNTGAATVNISTVQLSNSGDFTLTNNGCDGQAIDPNHSCSVDVTFNPSSTGTQTTTLDITDDDPSSPQTVDVAGQGVSPEFGLGTPSTFPDTVVGQTSQTQILVTNNTDYGDNLPSFSLGGSNPGQFNLDTSGCAASLGANASCSVNVSFQPTNTGQQNATLNLGGQSVSLTGTGTQASAQVQPNGIDFGNQPTATHAGATTITLKNTGTAALTYGSVSETGDVTDFPVSDAGCVGAILQPNGTCTITADFVPTATGARSATVTVHDSDPNNPTQTVNLTGNGTPSSVGFTPSTVTFLNPVVAGLASPVHGVKITNSTSKNMPIKSISIAGTNPKSFIRSADTCTGQTLAPNASCSVHVEFAPTAAGHRTAFLQVTDTGAVAPHTHVVTLAGTATSPNDPKAVHGAVGCQSAQISWVSPTATRFAGVRVVRNHAHFPASIGDGTVVPRSNGVATDTGLKHFTTYYYRVFATYHSKTRPADINYSAGVKMKLRTGEMCTPRNGARTTDRTPNFTWLTSATRNGYAFVLQRNETTIDIAYTRRTSYQLRSSWRYHGSRHRLVEGGVYTFFLFAYPKSHPNGVLIGQTTFTER